MAKILDSGERTEFETGAVRDLRKGKGRMDLCPLDVIAKMINSPFLAKVDTYMTTPRNGSVESLYDAVQEFVQERGIDVYTALLEVSMHYEEGCAKYGDYNWQKGIPIHCYIDSACRHYIKWRRGDKDEPHDRAVIWNIFGAIWTEKHKPEMQDIETKGAV